MSYNYFIVQKQEVGKTTYYVRGKNDGFGNKTLEPLLFFVENETIEERKARIKHNIELLNSIELVWKSEIDNVIHEAIDDLVVSSHEIQDKDGFVLSRVENALNSKLIYSRYSPSIVVRDGCDYYDAFFKLFNDENFDFQYTDFSELSDDELEALNNIDYIRRCDECGEWFYTDDLYSTEEGDYFCEDCVDDRTFVCDRCGYRHTRDPYGDNDRLVYNDGCDETWCTDCADNYATYCDSDGELHNTDDLYRVHDDSTDRDSYFYETREWCEDEAHYYVDEDEWWTDDCWDYDNDIPFYYADQIDDEEECEDYDDEELYVHEYSHTFTGLTLFGQYESKNTFGGIGFELEIAKKNRDANEQYFLKALSPIVENRVVLKRDGSINGNYGQGIEIVSMPHTFEEFWKNADRWKTMMKTAQHFNYVSHDSKKVGVSCGLHFHISRTIFGSDEETRKANITKVMYFFDKYYNDIIKFSRRKDNDAYDWASPYLRSGINLESEVERYESYNYGSHGDRYKAVNITNQPTVEFRIMRGTLIPETFFASADFVMTISKNSQNISMDNVDNVNEWLKGARPETIEYIKSRGAFEDTLELGGNE